MGSVIYETLEGGRLNGDVSPWAVDDQLLVPYFLDNSYTKPEGAFVLKSIDNYLFCDISLKVTASYGSTFAAGQWIELYMICEQLNQTGDDTNGYDYEDGSVPIEPPASNLVGSFQFVDGKAATQTHILRQIPTPPILFTFLLINKADVIDHYWFSVRHYRYQTI